MFMMRYRFLRGGKILAEVRIDNVPFKDCSYSAEVIDYTASEPVSKTIGIPMPDSYNLNERLEFFAKELLFTALTGCSAIKYPRISDVI